jgi:glucose/arabinose dehydrogenase
VKREALFALLPAVALIGCGGGDGEPAAQTSTTPRPATAEAGEGAAGPAGEPVRNRGGPQVETIAEGLESPWEIAFLPDGRAIVTERPGRVRLLERDLTLREQPIAEMDRVAEIGEGGLLGAAIDPRFADNGFVYFYPPPPRTRSCATASMATA